MKACLAGILLAITVAAWAGEVKRYPLPNNSTFPIARAVEVPAGSTIVYHSGQTPGPANAQAEQFSREFWGDTKTQAMSVFARMEASFDDIGVEWSDIVKMTVFLVGDPELDGRMDFDGFMQAYRQYFGTQTQPNLPARSAVQVAGLAAPGMLVEIEVVLVRK